MSVSVVMAGMRVRIPDGRPGTVAALYQDKGCGCPTIIVKLDSGREWVGRPSEVQAWR